MTEKIALELTLEELKMIDKYIEYHDYDCDKPLLEKIRNAYPHRSHIEEAYKEVYGCYPPTTPSVSNSEDGRWSAFQKGYNASKEDCKRVEEPKPPTLLHIVCEWCDDDIDLPCGELVNMIEQWLPGCKKGVGLPEYHLGWNEALRTIKEKLR